MKIEDLGLCDRTRYALHRNGIHTVEELRQMSDAGLLELRGLGPMGLAEIRGKITQNNEPSGGLIVMGKWTPAETPPQSGGEYIVYIKGAVKATTLRYMEEHWHDENGNCWYEVLYWMEMPKIPKRQEVVI